MLPLRFATEEQLLKPRSMALRCRDAAQQLNLKVRTLYDRKYLYKDGVPILERSSWPEILNELVARGADLPSEYEQVGGSK
jgi:hypothetical protein